MRHFKSAAIIEIYMTADFGGTRAGERDSPGLSSIPTASGVLKGASNHCSALGGKQPPSTSIDHTSEDTIFVECDLNTRKGGAGVVNGKRKGSFLVFAST